jgi:hypothetical protein
MVANILSALIGFFAFTGKLFEWLYARQLADAGATKEKLSELSKHVKDAEIAVAAREAARSAAISDPGRVSDDDGFRRD